MKRLFFVMVLALAVLMPQPTHAATGEYDQLARWARLFDYYNDHLPALENPFDTSAEAELWIEEIVPYFEYEGIVLPGMMLYPRDFVFEYYDQGQRHNHVLGTTNCLSGEITMNARFTNEISSWHGDVTALGTLIHELAHLQGICLGDRIDAESSAQLVTLELLAALSNRGSEHALATLLDELSSMAFYAAFYAALVENRVGDFSTLIEHTLETPWERARFAKAQRYWAGNPEKFQEILFRYNYTPMIELYDALTQNQTIAGVDLPLNHYCKYPPANYTGQETSEPCEGEPLVIDDLHYVITHIHEFVYQRFFVAA